MHAVRLSLSALAVVVGLAPTAVVVAPGSWGSESSSVDAPAATAPPRSGARAVTRVDNQLELRRAVARANRRQGVDRITLTRSMQLSKGNGKGDGALTLDIDVTDDLVLNGAGHRIDGRGLDRILDVGPRARLLLEEVTLLDGAPAARSGSGGLIRVDGGQARLTRVVLRDGRVSGVASTAGGAVMNDGGRVVLVDTTVANSTASPSFSEGVGGGVATDGGTTVLVDSVVRGNEGRRGGGLSTTGPAFLSLTRTDVRANRAADDGGGIWAAGSSVVTVDRSRISGNAAATGGAVGVRGGGGIYFGGLDNGGDGILRVLGSTLSGNTSSATGDGAPAGSGGGLLAEDGAVELRDTVVSGNSTLRDGGGVSLLEASTTFVDVQVVDNLGASTRRGTSHGGGLFVAGGTLAVSGGRIEDNTAATGGGVADSDAAETTMTGTSVVDNTASTSPDAHHGGTGAFTINGQAVPSGDNRTAYPRP